MVEAVMLWNEPNNLSHWDFKLDPDWKRFAEMVLCAAKAIRGVNPELKLALGGISPIDPNFVKLLDSYGVIDAIDVVAVHGFPLDWNHWNIHEWPRKIDEIRAVARGKAVWVSEAGASSFGAEEVQIFGLLQNRRAAAAAGRARALVQPLRFAVDLDGDHPPSRSRGQRLLPALLHGADPRGWQRQARRRAVSRRAWESANGFTSKIRGWTPAVEWLRKLGVRHLRTGISWADWFRENSEAMV